jgi:hypothetical protein
MLNEREKQRKEEEKKREEARAKKQGKTQCLISEILFKFVPCFALVHH